MGVMTVSFVICQYLQSGNGLRLLFNINIEFKTNHVLSPYATDISMDRNNLTE